MIDMKKIEFDNEIKTKCRIPIMTRTLGAALSGFPKVLEKRNLSMILRSIILSILLFIFGSTILVAQTNNEIFSKLLGVEVQTDKNIIVQLLKAEPGKKIFVDSDNDGKIDVLYMIDTDERHENQYKPILVKIVDEDGDMYLTGEGDLDSDLYIVDWHADGSIDRVIDYNDFDNDNDQDEQVQYYYVDSTYIANTTTKHRGGWLNKRDLPKNYPGRDYYINWARDYGDDNKLWWHINYDYEQHLTQWKSDYNGDEMLVNRFFYDYKENKIIPVGEIAFSFYDLDNDKYSEAALRFGGNALTVDNLRYSYDIDNDVGDTNVHDYDFSITCLGPIVIPRRKTVRVKIRNHTTEPVVQWEYMREVAKTGKWKKAHLTWDENDNNIADPFQNPNNFICNERWEGVINHQSEFMERVGGPSCGFYNKRNEIDLDYSGEMQFYYSPVDKRLHLYGAEVGWIKVDYNYDHKIDMFIWMEDTDKDGFFDTWKYDVNGDCLGKEHYKLGYNSVWKYEVEGDELYERVVHIENDDMQIIPFDYWTIHNHYISGLSRITDTNQSIISLMKKLLRNYEQNFEIDSVEDYFNSSLEHYRKDYHLGEKIKSSIEGTRYYQDIIRERYWQRLTRTHFTQNPFYKEIADSYNEGNFEKTSGLLKTKCKSIHR